jgi:micrococcal nuclease
VTKKSLHRRIILIVAIIAVLLITYAVNHKRVAPNRQVEVSQEATSSSELTRVTYVVDGDTIEVEGGMRVRYIGIDTPEMTKCFGSESKDENIYLVSGKTVRLVSDVSDKDSYGRLLRYVYVGNELVNDLLVRQGFAVAEPVKPDTLFAPQFLSAQNEAKQGNRGLWAACKKI